MYALLFILHGIFIVLSHLLGYYILEGIFLLFLLFFLLYFSPIFFSKKNEDFPTFSFSKISFSLQDSVLLPMIFFYIAIFFLFFAVTRDILESFSYNIFFFIIVYILFFLYIMAFDWKNDMFFDISRIHLIFSYTVIFFVVFIAFFYPQIVITPFLLLIISTIGFSIVYFFHARSTDILLFQGFLFSLMFSGFLSSVWYTSVVSYSFLLFSFGLSAIILFEGMPLYTYFRAFLPISRIYVLIAFLFSYIVSLWWAFFHPSFYGFIFIGIVFLFLIHIRYSNYIALSGAVFGIFFLYSLIFFPLITTSSLLSTLLFVFFLPLCIIWNTYFWEERFPYDFKMLHYSSILFSTIFSFYSLIFLSWWGLIYFNLSLSVFCLGFLLTLSYFRFRTQH